MPNTNPFVYSLLFSLIGLSLVNCSSGTNPSQSSTEASMDSIQQIIHQFILYPTYPLPDSVYPEIGKEFQANPALKTAFQQGAPDHLLLADWRNMMEQCTEAAAPHCLMVILTYHDVQIRTGALFFLNEFVSHKTVLAFLLQVARVESQREPIRGSEGPTLQFHFLDRLVQVLNHGLGMEPPTEMQNVQDYLNSQLPLWEAAFEQMD